MKVFISLIILLAIYFLATEFALGEGIESDTEHYVLLTIATIVGTSMVTMSTITVAALKVFQEAKEPQTENDI